MLKNLATGEWGYFAIGAFSVTETIARRIRARLALR
jgi:hypothetical protein